MELSPQQIKHALEVLLTDSSNKTKNGFQMLKANYHAEDRTISAKGLAKAAGYRNYNTGNEQYGSFAHKICQLANYKPEQHKNGVPIWTYSICNASPNKDKSGHFQWRLKYSVAQVLEELRIVEARVNSNVFDDLDLRKLDLETLSEKEKQSVILSRVGQGVFRTRLIHHWEGCSVTGLDNTDLLIASHIKPWRDCTASEAIDMTNGLLLVPNLDSVFDKGYISFDRQGSILISPQLSPLDAEMLGIDTSMQLRWCYPQHENFLKHHREKIFRKNR